jgi:hypothetical protein
MLCYPQSIREKPDEFSLKEAATYVRLARIHHSERRQVRSHPLKPLFLPNAAGVQASHHLTA